MNDYNGSDLESLSCSLDAVSVVEGNDCPYKGASFSKTPTNLLKHNLPNSSSSSFSTPPSLYCDICQSPLNSSSQLLSHLNGRKHRNRLALHTGLVSKHIYYLFMCTSFHRLVLLLNWTARAHLQANLPYYHPRRKL